MALIVTYSSSLDIKLISFLFTTKDCTRNSNYIVYLSRKSFTTPSNC